MISRWQWLHMLLTRRLWLKAGLYGIAGVITALVASIVAAGPGARNEKGELLALDVKAGDRVLFGKWSGTEVKIDGEDLLIMKESDILGIVEHTGALKKAA